MKLPGEMYNRMKTKARNNKNLQTLYSMTDRELNDIGLTRGGIKVDVKTSDWDWQNPQFKEAMWSTRMNARKQNADVDAYLFVKGKMPIYEVCGWQYKKEHLQQKKMNERTGQEYYYCMESQLRPMTEQYQQFGQ